MTPRPSSHRDKISPCLWFDDQAEEAVGFYVSTFDESRILSVTRYPAAGQDIHGRPPDSVMEIDFELNGRRFLAINGGPHFTFSPAVSFLVECESQEEIDHYWTRLGDGGCEERCGWLRDRFGVSWQIVPRVLPEMLRSTDPAKADQVMNAMLKMVKIDIAALRRAYGGEEVVAAEP